MSDLKVTVDLEEGGPLEIMVDPDRDGYLLLKFQFLKKTITLPLTLEEAMRVFPQAEKMAEIQFRRIALRRTMGRTFR